MDSGDVVDVAREESKYTAVAEKTAGAVRKQTLIIVVMYSNPQIDQLEGANTEW